MRYPRRKHLVRIGAMIITAWCASLIFTFSLSPKEDLFSEIIYSHPIRHCSTNNHGALTVHKVMFSVVCGFIVPSIIVVSYSMIGVGLWRQSQRLGRSGTSGMPHHQFGSNMNLSTTSAEHYDVTSSENSNKEVEAPAEPIGSTSTSEQKGHSHCDNEIAVSYYGDNGDDDDVIIHEGVVAEHQEISGGIENDDKGELKEHDITTSDSRSKSSEDENHEDDNDDVDQREGDTSVDYSDKIHQSKSDDRRPYQPRCQTDRFRHQQRHVHFSTVGDQGRKGQLGQRRLPWKQGISDERTKTKTTCCHNKIEKKKLSAQKRVALMGLLLAMCHCVCWGPYLFVHALVGSESDTVGVFTMWLAYCSTIVNPVIYTFFNRRAGRELDRYRAAFAKMMRNFFLRFSQ